MPFIYPTTYESRQIEPDLVLNAMEGRIGLQIMPVQTSELFKVRWTQQDNFFGLQQLRGLDGRPAHVKRVGKRTYEYEPGVFGEFQKIEETELTIRAGSMDVSTINIDVSDLIVNADNQLIQREMDRQESSVWAVLTTGTITIHMQGANGVMIGYTDTFPIQTFTASVPWSTAATSTPMADLTAVKLLGIPSGTSNNFGAGATAYMNTVTAERMLANLNANDLSGRRVEGGGTFNTVGDVSRLFVSRDLPQIVVYDRGYLDDNNVFQKFIPDGKVAVVGSRPGNARVGEYRVCRNVVNNYQAGSYRFVIDRVNAVNGEKRVPPDIEIHRGHNGGPVLFYPGAIVLMNV